MASLDPRIVKVSIDVGGGQVKTFSTGFQISAFGTKYANQLQNECQLVIENIDRDTQDYILTATSPFNLNYAPKFIRIEVGRESYGTTVLYDGNIINSSITQPPDIGLILKCLTGNYAKGSMVASTQGGRVALDVIMRQIATDLGVLLDFQATNKTIPNFQYAGPSLNQLTVINSYGGINAFIDNGTLICKDGFIPLNGPVTVVSAETGMIGIPTITEQGLRVKFLVDRQTRIGGGLQVISKQYPEVNGIYAIYKLGFEITSRDVPFYYVAECSRVDQQ